MTSRATDWLQRFAPLAVVALLFGVLTPFASHIGAVTRYELGQPAWPTICAAALACATFIVCVRALESQTASRVLVACVCVLAGPLLLGRWAPGLIVVGSIGATVLIPMLIVAIALSRAPARNGAGGVAALASLGPIGWLIAAHTLRPRSVFLRLDDMSAALAIGCIALAGTVAAAWLLPWPPPHEADRSPAAAGRSWTAVGACTVLAALASIDIDHLNHMVGAFAIYLIQTVALPIAAALCILPLSPRRRAGLYLAATLVGRFVAAAGSVGVEYATR